CRPCSSPATSPPATTRRRTPATSSSAAEPRSCAKPRSRGCRESQPACSRTRRDSLRCAARCSRPRARMPRRRSRRSCSSLRLRAELVALRRSIVVAGAHGKTTTTGMIAFCLDRLGLDPAFAVGGEIPQLGGNAGAGEGWLVVEGDESDRSVAALRPEVAVLLNTDLDHHTTFASLAEVEGMFEDWLANVPHAVRAEQLA